MPEIYASFAPRGGAFGSPELISAEGAACRTVSCLPQGAT
jgi:hypothetical protein